MKVDLGVWDWLGSLVVALLVAAALVGLVVWYLPQMKEHKVLQSHIYEKRQELEEEQQRIAMLGAEIEAFNRRETIERLARDLLNFARPDETVFRFEPEPPAAPVGRSDRDPADAQFHQPVRR